MNTEEGSAPKEIPECLTTIESWMFRKPLPHPFLIAIDFEFIKSVVCLFLLITFISYGIDKCSFLNYDKNYKY